MWKIAEKKDWKFLRDSFSWIRDMEGVVQDKNHHAEGDVAIHTRMVCDALCSLEGYQELAPQEQEVLFAAALLHDVEKRSTTEIHPDGSVTSRGHARKGKFTARRILYRKHQTPFKSTETVAALVRYHGLPLWAFDKPDADKAVIQASLEVDLKLLYLLCNADIQGRICKDQQQLFYRLELFRELAIELKCFEQARNFPSGLARYDYFHKEHASANYQPYEADCFPAYVLSALPGSGKDRYIGKHLSALPMVSLDQIRRANKIAPTDSKKNGWVIQEAKEKAREFLRKKTPFVWNATNITRSLRAPLIELFQSYGAHTELIYLQVPYRKLLRQNRDRPYPVPEKVLEAMIAKLDVPASWEAPLVRWEVLEADDHSKR